MSYDGRVWRLAVVAIGASACDYIWRVDAVAVVDGPALPLCSARVIDDSFGTTDLWGGASSHCNANGAEGNGQLVLQLEGGNACEQAWWAPQNAYVQIELTAGGVAVEVPIATGEPEAYTSLQLNDTDVELVVEQGNMKLTDQSLNTTYAEMPYDAQAMRWWRVRTDGTSLLADMSADATTWTTFATHTPTTLVTTTRLNILLGYSIAPTAPASSTFTHLIVCQ